MSNTKRVARNCCLSRHKEYRKMEEGGESGWCFGVKMSWVDPKIAEHTSNFIAERSHCCEKRKVPPYNERPRACVTTVSSTSNAVQEPQQNKL
ncbi:hypothetical protein NDU88_002756 [Pleurodeles waltl]|uniref:Uncharacterized protein n=1 Tax=Pleurodeles waltl TaxID=8319 RepID=A0AAV7MSB8_PLEWA|nr:hypothetical protein NDU88_002756 [Pleurodeles waltl]